MWMWSSLYFFLYPPPQTAVTYDEYFPVTSDGKKATNFNKVAKTNTKEQTELNNILQKVSAHKWVQIKK